MKRSMIIKLMSAFALAAFVFVSALSAQSIDTSKKTSKDGSAAKSAGITAHLGKVQLDASDVKILSKTAIPFKAIDWTKVKTKVDLNKTVKLPGGKQTTAKQYYEDTERWLNSHGHTLHGHKGGKVLLQQTVVDTKAHDDQAKKLTDAHLAFDAKTMRQAPSHTDLAASHQQTAAPSTADATQPATGVGKTAQTSKSWNYTLGNKNLVAAYLNGKIEVKGTKDDVTVTGSAAAGGYLMKKDINLIKANGSVYAPSKGKSKANLHVYLLGQHVINLDKSADTNFQLTGTKQHGIDVHADFHFSIGPIPVTAKVGAKGNAGVRYTINVKAAHATMKVTPFVDARVYAQVGVDLWLVSAGAGGEVVLLKDELSFGADLGLDFNATTGLNLTQHVYAQNKMTMLSGKVYAWAKISNPFGSDPEYHHDLFSWKGLQSNGYLFNIQSTVNVAPIAQPMATQTDATQTTEGAQK